jgi:hypothetical protein
VFEFARVRIRLIWRRAIEDPSAQPLEAESASHDIVGDIPSAIDRVSGLLEQAWSCRCFWRRAGWISASDFCGRHKLGSGFCSRALEAVSFIRGHETMLGSDEAIFICRRRNPETGA